MSKKKAKNVKPKTINIVNTGDFYHDLAVMESNDKHTVKNELGYTGLYQMGKDALKDAKYIDMKTGEWLGKNGINSKISF